MSSYKSADDWFKQFETPEPEQSKPNYSSADEWFNQFEEPSAEPEESSWVDTAKDIGSSFGIGSNMLLKSVGSIYGLVTGDMDNEAVRMGQRGIDFYEDTKSEGLRAKQAAVQEKVANADGFWSQFGTAISETATDPELFANFLVEQLPMTVAGGGVGGAAARVAGARVGTGVGLATSGGLNGADVGSSVYEESLKMPEELWDNIPEFRAMEREVGREEAKDTYATYLARQAAAGTAALSVVTGKLLPDTIEKRMAGLGGEGGLLTRTTRAAAGEGLQEIAEEGGGNLIGNVVQTQIDPNQDILEGVGQSSALGLLGGGVTGGTIGALSPTQRINEEMETARQVVAEQGGDALDQARAATEAQASGTENFRGRFNLDPIDTPTQPINGEQLPEPEIVSRTQVVRDGQRGEQIVYSDGRQEWVSEDQLQNPLEGSEEQNPVAQVLDNQNGEQNPVAQVLDNQNDVLAPTEFSPATTDDPIPATPFESRLDPITPPDADIDADILYLDRIGDAEGAVRLRTAKMLFERAQEVNETNSAQAQKLRSRAAQLAGYEYQNEMPPSEPYVDPDAPLEGEVIPSDGEPVDISARRTTVGDEVIDPERPPLTIAESREEMIKRRLARQPRELPPGSGAIVAGQERSREANPEATEQAFYGEIKRPDVGISPEAYEEAVVLNREGIRQPLGSRTEEQKEAIETIKAVRAGRIKVTASRAASEESANRFLEDQATEELGTPVERETVSRLDVDAEVALSNQLDQMSADIDEIDSRVTSLIDKKSSGKSADPANDDWLTAIRKLGGISTEEAVRQNLDPESFSTKRFVGSNRPIKKNGVSFDEMGEKLWDAGFFNERPDANTVLQVVSDALNSTEPTFPDVSTRGTEIAALIDQENYMRGAIAEVEQELYSQFGEELTADDVAYLDTLFRESLDVESQRSGSTGQNAQQDVGGGDRRAVQPTAQAEQEGAGVRQEEGIGANAQDAGTNEGFQLDSYTEEDLRNLNERESTEVRDQVDREREQFDLSAPAETISGSNLNDDTSDMFGATQPSTEEAGRNTEAINNPNPNYKPAKPSAFKTDGGFEFSEVREDSTSTVSKKNFTRTVRKDGNLVAEIVNTDGYHVVIKGGNRTSFETEKAARDYATSENTGLSEDEINNRAREQGFPNWTRPTPPSVPETEIEGVDGAAEAESEKWSDFLYEQVNNPESPVYASQGIYNLIDRIENLNEYPRPTNEWDTEYFQEISNEYERVANREASRDVKMSSSAQYGPAIPAEEMKSRWKSYDQLNQEEEQNGYLIYQDLMFIPPPVSVSYRRQANYQKVTREEAKKIRKSWKENAASQRDKVHPDGMTNSSYTVLSLFDTTGEWSKPWREAGYNVIQVDIQDGVDVEDMLDWSYWNSGTGGEGEIYAVIAAPPCTALTAANNRNWKKADQDGKTRESQKMLSDTMDVIEFAKPAIWAVENPAGGRVGLTISGKEIESKDMDPDTITNAGGFPMPVYDFEHRTFGDEGVKPTSIWGNVNPSMPTARIDSTAKDGNLNDVGGKTLEAMNVRSQTPEGFAYAFFQANNALDNFNTNDNPLWTKQWLALRYPGGHSVAMAEAVDAGVPTAEIARIVSESYSYGWNEANEETAEALREAISEIDSEAKNRGPDDTLLRRKNRKPMSKAEFDVAFDTVMTQIFGGNKPDWVVTVPSFGLLPQNVQDSARRQGGSYFDTQAAISGSTIYIVESNTADKIEIEEAIFHEASHGGLNEMLMDKGVIQATERLWMAIGGMNGLRKKAKQLGISKQMQKYIEGTSGNYDSFDRKWILINELVAFQGEKGSKSIATKGRELLGAIRDWLRKKGYLSLSKVWASDIAFLARKSREQYIQKGPSGRNLNAFLRQEDAGLYYNDMGFYSPMEKMILEQGDKLFRPSKKNPEGAVSADQVLKFLKSKGAKPEELKFSRVEEDLNGLGSLKITKEWLLNRVRDSVRVYDDVASTDPDSEENEAWFSSEPIDDPDYVRMRAEDILDEYMNGYDPDGFLENRLSGVPYRASLAVLNELSGTQLEDAEERLSGIDNFDAKQIYLAQEIAEENDLNYEELLLQEFREELEERADEMAQAEYDENPYREIILDADSGYQAIGNEDVGYSISINGSNVDTVYSEDEARLVLENRAREDGVLGDPEGDTRYWSYMQLEDELDYIETYSETQIIWENPTEGSYRGAHWDENNLAGVLSTDRVLMGEKALVIEELQSDWHSDARKAGGFKDDGLIKDLKAKLKEANNTVEKAVAALGAIEERVADEILKDAPVAEGRRPAYAYDVLMSMKDARPLYDSLTDEGKKAATKFALEEMRDASASPTESAKDWIISNPDYFIDPIGRTPAGSDLKGLKAMYFIPEGSFENAELVAHLDEWSKLYPITRDAQNEESKAEDELMKAEDRPPVAPWGKDKYLEIAGGRMLLRAAESGKDRIMWANGARVQQRWSDNFNYGAIYDGKLKKVFEKKLGKKAELTDMDGRTLSFEEVKARTEVDMSKYSTEKTPRNSSYGTWEVFDENEGRRVSYTWEEFETKEEAEAYFKEQIAEKKTKELARDYPFWSIKMDASDRSRLRENGMPLFRMVDDSFEMPENRLRDVAVRKLVDKFQPLKQVQRAIEEFRGSPISQYEDVYRAEELFHGTTGEDLQRIEKDIIEPLTKAMADANIDIVDMDEFLVAKHARERNAYIASINEAMPDGGSGMTNAEADAVLAKLRSEGRLQDFERIASQIYSITQTTRDLIRVAGLQPDEMTDSWEGQYDFYVPLRGFAENEVEVVEGRDRKIKPMRTGKGFDIRGKEAKEAMGRSSLSFSPTSYVLEDLIGKTIRYRKNEVGKKFLNLVENNPNPDLWEVFDANNPEQARKISTAGGERKVVYGSAPMFNDPNYFAVKVDGEIKYIKVKDDRILDAMLNMGPEGANAIVKYLGPITRMLSSLNTSYDPEFMVSNFARDIQTALVNISAEQTREDGRIKGESIAGDALKGVPQAIKAVGAMEFKNKPAGERNEFEQYYQEFKDDGAKTGYFDAKDVAQIAQEVNDLVKMASGKGAGVRVKKAVKGLGDFVEVTNTSVENGIRLSTYIAARKAGVSRSDAASLAKNLTVNFNRKGQWGSAVNSLYMFYNAAIQGTAQFARSMGGNPIRTDHNGKKRIKFTGAQKFAAKAATAAYALAYLNRLAAGEDDDGENWFDKVPQYERERNLIIMKSLLPWNEDKDGAYWKIPLPYGYNIFFNLGDSVEAMVNSPSPDRKKNMAGNLAAAFMTSFSPFGMNGSDDVLEKALLTGSPTLMTPFLEVGLNVNHFGSPVYPDFRGFGAEGADAYKSFNSTKNFYKKIAEAFNEGTGGSQLKSGGIDVSPAVLEHIVEFAGGGVYRFGSRMSEVGSTIAEDRELDVRNTPFRRRLEGEVGNFGDTSLYWDRRDEVLAAAQEFKEARGSAGKKEADRIHDGKRRLKGILDASDRQLRNLRKRRDRIRGDDELSPADRDSQLRNIEERMDKIYDKFNKRYNEFVSK